MATFQIQSKSFRFTGTASLTQNNPANIVVTSRQLEVTVQVDATLAANEDYYLGYIQVCTANQQVNHYSNNVEQRWEFKRLPVSDAAHSAVRPWYGTGADGFIAGFRRVRLTGPLANAAQVMSMTDCFRPTVAKRDTLNNGSSGPNKLLKIVRDQSFRTWLVHVPRGQASQQNQYTRLFQLDWRYRLEYQVNLVGSHALVQATADNPTCVEKPASLMDAIPVEAWTSPVANDNQKLRYYQNGVKGHVIVARVA